MAAMVGRSKHLRQILGSCEGNVEVSNRVDPYQVDQENVPWHLHDRKFS